MAKASILHERTINAPLKRVYTAITTEKGLKSWWTQDTIKKGKELQFGFYKRTTLFRMRIKEQKEHKIVWKCIGDEKEWKGTTITFLLSKDPEKKGTVLKFRHAGWRSTKGWFGMCNDTWALVLTQLKKYVEKQKPAPYFRH